MIEISGATAFCGRVDLLSDDRSETVDIDGSKVLDGLISCHFPVQDTQHFLKSSFADFIDTVFALNNDTGVEIHIVFHPFVSIWIAADFDHRHARKALRGTAAGGEHHKLGACCSHTCQDFPVHVPEYP